jgi:transglutaminase-like putative cysteine protease
MTNDTPTPAHRAATPAIDTGHPAVQAFAHEHARGANDRERAIALTLAVRDGFRYDPYRIDLSLEHMRASNVITQGFGWCVPKATLLAAVARVAGIAARLGFADVRNHLSTEKMRQTMQTDLFIWHGYAELWLDGAWRKATPAFNLSLCQKFGLHALDFDGVHDSLYHPFDKAGNRHMEYVNDHGSFDDLPLSRITADFRRVYPGWMPAAETNSRLGRDDFEADVARETAKAS